MSHTDAKELLAAVQGFLRQSVLPQLEGFDAYTTRVAANSLAIVSREIAARDDILELDREAGSRWLGPAAGASPDEENHPAARALSLALRDGRLQVRSSITCGSAPCARWRSTIRATRVSSRPGSVGPSSRPPRVWQNPPTRSRDGPGEQAGGGDVTRPVARVT